jgi:hypothetical protein
MLAKQKTINFTIIKGELTEIVEPNYFLLFNSRGYLLTHTKSILAAMWVIKLNKHNFIRTYYVS